MIHLIILLIIAAVCGSLAQAIVGYSRGGCIVSIVLGFIGALIGMYIANALSLPELITVAGFPVVWSIIGAVLFVAVLSLISRQRG